MSAAAGAKERLLRLREREIKRLRAQGRLAQFDVIDAAIAALDTPPADVDPAGCAMVSEDGKIIRLTLYAEAGAVASVELSPVRAVAVAGKLIDAALAKLE
jgi:hypothetical protein